MKQKFNVGGMSCSACAASVEKAVKRVDGVKKAEVSLISNTMLCEYSGDITADIIKAVENAGFTASVSGDTVKKKKASSGEDTDIRVRLSVSVVFLVLLMYVSMGHMINLPFTDALYRAENAVICSFLQFLLTLPVLFVNRVFYSRGIKALIKGSPNMDTLISLGSGAAVVYGIASVFIIGYHSGRGDGTAALSQLHSLYFESASMILTLVTVGKYLEQRAKTKTNSALMKLRELSPDETSVIRDSVEIKIKTSEIISGDIIVLRPGELCPVDGIITEGESSFDVSALTGESIPVDKKAGDGVMSASFVLNGHVRIRATSTESTSTLGKIISLVEEAGTTKAPVSRIADKISGIFVPVVMCAALISAVIWLIIGKSAGFALGIGISVLVVSCPCALGLATPVAVTAAIGKSASGGILIKSAEVIETLCKADVAVLDKTGTVTEGKPSVTDVIATGNEAELIKFAASLEAGSEHPLSTAVCGYYKGEYMKADNFKAVFGKGVSGVILGDLCLGGNRSFMLENGIDTSPMDKAAETAASEGKTPLWFSRGASLLGIICVADTLKSSSARAVSRLKSEGLRVIMLTGDNRATSEAIARQAGIDEVFAEVLPQDKEKLIGRLKDEGHRVIMTGDGINDSPSLMRADIGISISSGADIAVDSSDVVLLRNYPEDVCEAFAMSRKAVRIIKENLFWAFFYNVIGIPIAAGALYSLGILLSPMIAAAAMSLSSLFVVTNALRIFKKTRR